MSTPTIGEATGTTGPSVAESAHVDESAQPSIKRIWFKDLPAEQKSYYHLKDENWIPWQDDIMLVLDVCNMIGYITGEIVCPNEENDREGAQNWIFNDKITRKVIRDCLSKNQKYHTAGCKTAREMWTNLQAYNQVQGDHTESALMRELNAMKACEGNDIVDHLEKLR